jgi:hypothetical protein
MFYAIALTARHMSKLRIMEIWTDAKGHASIFRYRTTDGFSTLSWHSVWGLQLEPCVIKG